MRDMFKNVKLFFGCQVIKDDKNKFELLHCIISKM